MRVIYDKSLQRVELIPEGKADFRLIDEQFGPWEAKADSMGLRGPIGEDFELMLCRREGDGAILIEIARSPEAELNETTSSQVAPMC